MRASYWTKEQRERATKDGKSLLSVAIDGNKADKSTGKYEHYGPCPAEKARFVFFFSFYLVQQELSYQDAYAKAVKMILEKPADGRVQTTGKRNSPKRSRGQESILQRKGKGAHGKHRTRKTDANDDSNNDR